MAESFREFTPETETSQSFEQFTPRVDDSNEQASSFGEFVPDTSDRFRSSDLVPSSSRIPNNRAAGQLPSIESQGWAARTFNVLKHSVVRTGAGITGRIGHLIGGPDPFEDWEGYFNDVLERHPEWRPRQLKSAWDLLSSPTKLLEQVATQVPYIAAFAAGRAAGAGLGAAIGSVVAPGIGTAIGLGVGFLVSGLIAYAVEGEAAYDDVIARGGSESEAETSANIVGAANASLETLQFGRFAKLFTGRWKQRAIKGVVGRTLMKVGVNGKVIDLSNEIAKQGIQEAMQGAVSELVPLKVAGLKIDEGFLDRRMTEAVAVTPISLLFGGAGHVNNRVRKSIKGIGAEVNETDASDTPYYSRDKFRRDLIDNFKHKPEEADAIVTLTDARAETWSQRTGRPAEEWYSTHLTSRQELTGEEGEILFQSPSRVNTFFSKLEQTLMSDQVQNKYGSGEELLKRLKALGVKNEELRWTQLDSALLKKSGSVTRVEALEFVQNNKINVEEILKSNQYDASEQERLDGLRKENYQLRDESRQIYDMVAQAETQEEIRVGLQHLDRIRQRLRDNEAQMDQIYEGGRAKYEGVSQLEGPIEDYQELLISKQNEEGTPDFQSEHWNESNVLVHARTTTRIDDQGRRVLFVEEIQSDWHQKARDNYKADLEDIAIGKIGISPEQAGEMSISELKESISSIEEENLSSLDKALVNARGYDTVERAEEAQESAGVPEAPFRTNFPEVAIKALYRMASEQGADAVAWTSGQQQAVKNNQDGTSKEEGQKHFYDRVIPRIFRDVGRQKDKKVDVGRVRINTGSSAVKLAVDRYRDLIQREERTLELTRSPGEVTLNIRNEKGEVVETRFHNNRDFTAIFGRELFDRVSSEGRVELNSADQIKGTTESLSEQQAILLTDQLRQRTLDEGFALFQGPKGRTLFASDGRAVIEALEKPDLSTVLHELAHVFRRDLDGEELEIAAAFSGVERNEKGDLVWTRESEERFSRGFERYLREGNAPSGDLASVFETFKNWLRNIYRRIRGSAIDVKLNPEIRGVFDRLFVNETQEVQGKRQEIRELNERLSEVAPAEKISDQEIARQTFELWKQRGRPVGMDEELRAEVEAEVKQASELRDQIKKANKELEKLKLGQGTWTSRLAQYSESEESLRTLIAQSESIPPEQRKRFKSHMRSTFYNTMQWIGQSHPLFQNRFGRALIQAFDEGESYVQGLKGQAEDRIAQTFLNLSLRDRRWLKQVDENNYSNLRKMVDQTGVRENVEPRSRATRELRDMLWWVQELLGSEAEQAGVLRRLEDGTYRPFERSKYGKLFRIPTEEMWRAMERKGGRDYEAIIEAIKRENPELERKDIEGSLDQMLGIGRNEFGEADKATRRVGMLEEVRKIKFMPDHVDINGRKVAIFHTNPYELAMRALDLQGRRIAFTKQFGYSGVLSDIEVPQLRNLASTLGIDVGFTKEDLKNNLRDKGVADDQMEGLNTRQLRKMARKLGVSTSISREYLVDQIQRVNPAKLSGRQRRKIMSKAKKLGGIDTTQDFFNIFKDVKARVSMPTGDIVQQLREGYLKEGGKADHFDDVLRLWQGLPYHWLKRGPIQDMAKFTSQTLGALQTSLSVAPNIAQTFTLVPRAVGMGRFVKAVKNVMQDSELTRSQMVAMGAMRRTILNLNMERGYLLEGLGRNIRQVIGDVTGLRYVSEHNNMIAGEAFRLLAEDWNLHGMNRADVPLAKNLRLNEKEISQLRRGEGLSDATRSKIVQSGIATTQFVTESRHRKSKIENIPILNMLVNYFNYTAGMTRASVDMVGMLKEHVNTIKKNPKDSETRAEIGKIGGLMFRTLVGALGAGVASDLLRDLMKGDLETQDDESMFDRGLAGFVEIQLFGAAHRAIEPWKYGGNNFESALLSIFPQLNATKDLIKTSLKYGRYGEFPWYERVFRTTERQAPAVRAAFDWAESASYPFVNDYDDTRSNVGTWVRDNEIKEESRVSGIQINEKYFKIFEMVRRGDMDSARELASQYYRKELSEGETLDDAMNKLRSSLINRAPINLNSLDTMRFLISQDDPDKVRKFFTTNQRYRAIVDSIAP